MLWPMDLEDYVSYFDQQVFLPVAEIIRRLPGFVRLVPHDSEDHRRLTHKLYREIIPITFAAKLTGAVAIRFTNDKSDPDNSFDGVLKFSDGSRQIVECTSGIPGRHSAKLSKYLKQIGASFMPPFVPHRANMHKDSAAPSGSYVSFVAAIKKAINRKIKKNNASYRGAWLIVTTNYPWFKFSTRGILSKRFLRKKFSVFSRVFILNGEGRLDLDLVFDYKSGEKLETSGYRAYKKKRKKE